MNYLLLHLWTVGTGTVLLEANDNRIYLLDEIRACERSQQRSTRGNPLSLSRECKGRIWIRLFSEGRSATRHPLRGELRSQEDSPWFMQSVPAELGSE